ncbi:hypothetical protein FQN52_005827 [Onygenales sp. PD_12]|nr:hypothetical protein FQN52_005827 [Onygenales sp. PD_12]
MSPEPTPFRDTHPGPLDWGAFLTSVIAVNTFWWLWDIPLIWQRGFRAYVDGITWECVRLYMPTVAGAFAIYHTEDRSRWPKLYYYGGRDEALCEYMSDTEVMRIFVTDSLTISATVLTLCQFYLNPSSEFFNMALWAFPSAQASLIGFWIVGASYTRYCSRRTIFIAGGILLVSVGGCVASVLASAGRGVVQTWIPPTVLYFYMAAPFCLYSWEIFVAIVVIGTTFARVGGLAFSTLLPNHFVPSHSLRNPLFGVTYLIVGIIGGILAIYGRSRLKNTRLVLNRRRKLHSDEENPSLIDRSKEVLATFRAHLRKKRHRKFIAEKEGTPRFAAWPQRQSQNYRQIQPSGRAYCTELMADEYPSISRTVCDSPDEEIRRALGYEPPIPAVVIRRATDDSNQTPVTGYLEPTHLRDGSETQTPRIKRKPVGSASPPNLSPLSAVTSHSFELSGEKVDGGSSDAQKAKQPSPSPSPPPPPPRPRPRPRSQRRGSKKPIDPAKRISKPLPLPPLDEGNLDEQILKQSGLFFDKREELHDKRKLQHFEERILKTGLSGLSKRPKSTASKRSETKSSRRSRSSISSRSFSRRSSRQHRNRTRTTLATTPTPVPTPPPRPSSKASTTLNPKLKTAIPASVPVTATPIPVKRNANIQVKSPDSPGKIGKAKERIRGVWGGLGDSFGASGEKRK